MNMIAFHLHRFLLVFCLAFCLINGFSPDTSNYDLYGVKIAINDVLYAQAKGAAKTFLVQFAPFNFTMETLQCTLNYNDSTHYVYSVGVGIKQNGTTDAYFYFTGEVASDWSGTDSQGRNGTFIGVWINRDPHSIAWYFMNRQSLPCNYFATEQMQFLRSYSHQEYYVMAVEPYGTYAFGIAADFIFRYTPFPTSSMTTKAGTSVWPNNATFYPCAADTSDKFTIIAGFAGSSAHSRVRATPTVYLMWNSNMTILSTWSYNATANSWQSRLTYSNILSWSSQYTMSVKINVYDSRRVLVGMPFLNTVFMFTVENNGTSLRLNSSRSNGNSVGFGKSVTWLTDSQAAILSLSYSMDWKTLYSSRVNVYTSMTSNEISATPTAVIPNAQQPLPSTLSSEWIRLVSTPASIAVLDSDGAAMIVLAEQSGYYASTDVSKSPLAAAMPVVSVATKCIGGTYKSDTGIHPCTLCPKGSRNPGISACTACMNCSADSFCPLGALDEVDSELLEPLSQAYAYPTTPEMDVFEDILLANMFSLGSTGHCLVVSPIFWILIILFIIVVALIGMASMNLCVQPPKRDIWRARIKSIFQQTDLVGEGELWIGGLASIAVVFMTAMAYYFAISYLNQYPAEDVGPSNFACDTTIRNSKYSSSLQPLAVPRSDSEQPIFDLLDKQNFTLNLEFLNTGIPCMSVTINEVIESSTVELIKQSCASMNGTLSFGVFLPDHDMTVQVVLNDIHLVGGFRMGLSGSGAVNDSYTLQDLNFREVFISDTRTLAQKATIAMAMTKVVNETESLSGGDSTYGGIWYPTFTYSITDMFVTANTYVMSSNLSSTTITIDITETSYYIKNVQSPIAKQGEVIFRTLLFAFLCLELCAMAFLIFKLIVVPIANKLYSCFRTGRNCVEPEDQDKHSHKHYP